MLYFALAAGLALLMLCGDVLVRGSVGLALRLGIPNIVIGLTIVAFGTSAPELVVSLRAALTGATGIAIGNVVGSNIANVFLVLGLPALICATNCDQPYIRRNMLFVLGTSVLFVALCLEGTLGFWDGAILFSLIIVYLLESGRRAMQHANGKAMSAGAAGTGEATSGEEIDGVSALAGPGWRIALFVFVGVIGLALGAHITVFAASGIAQAWGVSEAAVGLTVVALGTSLPELATTLAAALRGHSGLALGNVLGSNIFNLLAIMGLTAMVVPIPVPEVMMQIDVWIMLGASLVVAPFAFLRVCIPRVMGVGLVAAYLVYVYFVLTTHTAVGAAVL